MEGLRRKGLGLGSLMKSKECEEFRLKICAAILSLIPVGFAVWICGAGSPFLRCVLFLISHWLTGVLHVTLDVLSMTDTCA